ncbi:hypothetical protein QE450_003610 [Paenibacillus sp. SORGH_AS306]|uniref:hypothetical protein n=1 Tax=unclassified Paenibacillus TaxID=185978 RepID=UPI0027867FF9|nr:MULTISPECIES: hypothetical protein [unclassified Paenibacillus]MDQ1236112.1 hypothetical protein [Paenibacillus sp. SORGH_AS_0306]MDR6108467.1 hypothetical protein [Paenibacillus sp. SORGH_AS_0338]
MKIITVPINAQGIKDMEYDSDCSMHVQELKIDNESFYKLYKTGIFDVLNRTCNVIIDDFESEWIKYDQLFDAIDEVEKIFKDNTCYELTQLFMLIKLAISKKTGIYFYF